MICLFVLVALSLQAQRFVCSPLLETNKQTIYTLSGCRDVSAPVVSSGVYSLTVSSVGVSSVGGAGTYSSTLYTPFSTESPAPLVAVDNDGMVKRRAFGGEGMGSDKEDDPNRSEYSPLGDAWSMLLLALGYGILIMIRKKNTIYNQISKTGYEN